MRRLLEERVHVTVFDNFATGSRSNLPASSHLRIVDGDLRTADLAPLVGNADYIFHLAAQVGNVKSIERPEDDAGTNVLGSVRLLAACRESSVRKIVYSSSSAIFGEADRLPIDEHHPTRPASFYALSKLTAERYALLSASLWGLPAVCLRYFNVFGLPMEENEYTGVISIFLRRLAADEPIVVYGDGLQVRDFVYVKDVVSANLLAAVKGQPGQVYNIGSGSATTVVDLARVLAAVVGRQPTIRFDAPRAGEVRLSLASIDRAREELGYAPVYDLDRGLREMWEQITATAPAAVRPR